MLCHIICCIGHIIEVLFRDNYFDLHTVCEIVITMLHIHDMDECWNNIQPFLSLLFVIICTAFLKLTYILSMSPPQCWRGEWRRRTLQLPAPVITSTNICVLAYMLSPIFAYFPHSCQPCDLLVAMPYLHMHNVNTDKKSRAGKSEIRKIPDIRRISAGGISNFPAQFYVSMSKDGCKIGTMPRFLMNPQRTTLFQIKS